MENKIVDFKIEDGKLIISADPNKNGKPVLYVSLDIMEVPAEIVSILKKD